MNRRKFLLMAAIAGCVPGVDGFEDELDPDFRGPQNAHCRVWGSAIESLVPGGAVWGSATLGWMPSLWCTVAVYN